MSNGGLNVIIREFITNQSGTPWSGFRWTLVDDTPINPDQVPLGDFGAHPIAPHFHNVGGGFLPFTTFNDYEARPFINLANGPFESDGIERTWESVRLHNREVAGKLRTFRLVETPIPEPSSLALLVIGIFTLCLRRRETGTYV